MKIVSQLHCFRLFLEIYLKQFSKFKTLEKFIQGMSSEITKNYWSTIINFIQYTRDKCSNSSKTGNIYVLG